MFLKAPASRAFFLSEKSEEGDSQGEDQRSNKDAQPAERFQPSKQRKENIKRRKLYALSNQIRPQDVVHGMYDYHCPDQENQTLYPVTAEDKHANSRQQDKSRSNDR